MEVVVIVLLRLAVVLQEIMVLLEVQDQVEEYVEDNIGLI